MATSTRCNRVMSVWMVLGVEDVGVVFDAQAELLARAGFQCQRVVGGFVGRHVGDGELVGIRQCGGVDRVVLVDEQGVEQLVVAGDAVDRAKCQVLVIQGVVVGVSELGEQLAWWW